MKTRNPTIHGDRKTRTVPYLRSAIRRRRERDGRGAGARSVVLAATAMTSLPSGSSQLALLVDLVGDSLQALLQVRDVPREVLVAERRPQLGVGRAQRRDRLVRGAGVLEDLEERGEVLVGVQRRVVER